MKIFVIEGWLVGGAGTVLGLLLGLLVASIIEQMNIGIAADVYMVGSVDVQLNPTEICVTLLASMLISHLATIYPALRAARQSPVDAMRYD